MKLLQNWWHIIDKPTLTSRYSIKNPFRSSSRLIRQVMDIQTDKNSIQAPITQNFVRLKIRNKNNGHELPFLDENGKISINLIEIDHWPLFRLDENNTHHVKIEIEYELFNQEFKSQAKDFLKKLNYYKSAFSIKQIQLPEFYLTVPIGCKLNKETSKLLFIITCPDDDSNKNELNELKEKIEKLGLELIDSFKIGEYLKTVYKIRYDGPSIDFNDKLRRYSYLVISEDFEKLKKIYDLLENDFREKIMLTEEIYFGYEVQYDKHLLFPLIFINYILIASAMFRILQTKSFDGIGFGFLSYLIIIVSLISLKIKLYEDAYPFPVNLLTYLSLLILFIGITSEFIS